VARGDISAIEMVERTLARIHRLNPRLNAFLHVLDEAAREGARRAEERRARGATLGPLFGVPFTVKDLILTKDAPTTAGSRIFGDGLHSDTDAPVVARLRNAGAILVGKTHLHEVALGITNVNEHYGPARNPWDRDRVTGGSSGGSAAAVAAGLGYASIGTDTRGSIRIPAACCGVTGIKPTTRLVQTEGVLPLSTTLDHVGPLARSVEDAALMLGLVSGGRTIPAQYQEALGRRVEGLRIGLCDYHLRDLDPEVARAVEEAGKRLARSGVVLCSVEMPELDDALQDSYVIGGAEAVAHHDADLQSQPASFGPRLRERLEAGYRLTAVDYVRAQRGRRRVIEAFDRTFREVDALLGATVPVTAAPIGSESVSVNGRSESIIDAYLRLTAPQSMGGVPALSLPCGFSNEGLPIGLQLMADRHREDLLFTLGSEYQRTTDWHQRRPPVDD
jgi:aspartyl-tRNA(Asn)/glutamyl-tRNA(Gln) amidotransferase subunit A